MEFSPNVNCYYEPCDNKNTFDIFMYFKLALNPWHPRCVLLYNHIYTSPCFTFRDIENNDK